MDHVTSHRVKKYMMLTDTKNNQSWILRCANIPREDVVNSLQLGKGYQWAGYRLTAPDTGLYTKKVSVVFNRRHQYTLYTTRNREEIAYLSHIM